MKKNLTILYLSCLFVIGISGCMLFNIINNGGSFITTCKVSKAAIGVKTLGVQLTIIGESEARANKIIVQNLEICIDGWHKSIIDGNLVSPEQVACAINTMNQLNAESKAIQPEVDRVMQAMYGKGLRDIPIKADANEIESAYQQFKTACAGYYYWVDFVFGDSNATGNAKPMGIGLDHKLNVEVEVFKGASGQWRWRMLNFENKKIIAESGGDGYHNRLDCVNEVERILNGVNVKEFFKDVP